ncbi:triosephosphate isomerase [Fluviicoccus keumensis]|uniref:Triosephosphate isomerase n=1 Tax=Fluviicoccus keumensis TaxID=1435465 RepID=A0A4Q7YL51_9GAMM|nr:triose-phosphate isomerase [Fluviicoccus keumensis]RZU38287.1 triosephosphate isomerase [Fluviicoccus keumensis]
MSHSRQKLVIGNWKMNGGYRSAQALLQPLVTAGVSAVVAPPFVYLSESARQLAGSSVSLAAQDVAAEAGYGAFTGEVSARMLAEAGVRYVIVGHSERRQYYGETDAQVAEKSLRTVEEGMIPVICVGETLAQREAGQAFAVVSAQLMAIADCCGVDFLAGAVVAYEPVWAIGTGRTATPDDAQAMHAHLRGVIAGRNPGIAAGLRILYGGSVKADNAASLFAMPDIDGALVGGASLLANDFLAICRAAGL